MVATAIYSVTMVLWKETAFPLCRAMERGWKKECCLPGVFCDSGTPAIIIIIIIIIIYAYAYNTMESNYNSMYPVMYNTNSTKFIKSMSLYVNMYVSMFMFTLDVVNLKSK